jgi:hypothetical protein
MHFGSDLAPLFFRHVDLGRQELLVKFPSAQATKHESNTYAAYKVRQRIT